MGAPSVHRTLSSGTEAVRLRQSGTFYNHWALVQKTAGVCWIWISIIESQGTAATTNRVLFPSPGKEIIATLEKETEN